MTSAITASSGEIENIIVSTPTTVSSEVSSWLSVCCSVCAMLSMSLVTRLSSSPRGWPSKYGSGSRLSFSSDLGAQLADGRLDDAVEQVALEPQEQAGADVQQRARAAGRCAELVEVDARPGHDVRPCSSRFARLSSPRARSARSTACCDGRARRQLPADEPGEDDVGGAAEDLRADHRQRHAGDGRATTITPSCSRYGAQPARAGASPTGRSSSTSPPAGPAFIHGGPPRRPPRRRPAAAARGTRRPFAAASAVAFAHAAAPALSCDSTISAYVGQVSSSSCVACRRRRSAPSSSTTIWSASTIVETRWATTITRGVGGDRLQRRPQPGVGAEVERRERVVEQVDLGPPHERAGDREPLPLAAGDVACRPGRSARRGPPASPRRSRAPGRSRGTRHSSSSVASGLP